MAMRKRPRRAIVANKECRITHRFYLLSAGKQSRSRKSRQCDKWIFCLTAGTFLPAHQEFFNEQKTTPEPLTSF